MTMLKQGDPFLYMKVGVHANESLQDIILRKRAEIAAAGVSFWGYGGNSCHPFTAVQPFVKQVSANGTKVMLLMEEISSHHYAAGKAKEFSADGGNTYQPVPKGVNVIGSRFALIVNSLDDFDLSVPLSKTSVGIGRMVGTRGDQYIRGRVDKACLVYDPAAHPGPDDRVVKLSLAAQLAQPYAVVLR
ncbi:hypothetical protein [Thiomonas sp. FB-Cd]|uniref:hypothetical protein n=1 Tax=Thiomonas sp. FB-Cd TaxID=1158292 RepID=UPI0004DF8C26|nr:hypothetical protein [Thiomonas sp. FB-Cd]